MRKIPELFTRNVRKIENKAYNGEKVFPWCVIDRNSKKGVIYHVLHKYY